jgi:hypothetical protein
MFSSKWKHVMLQNVSHFFIMAIKFCLRDWTKMCHNILGQILFYSPDYLISVINREKNFSKYVKLLREFVYSKKFYCEEEFLCK